MTTIQNPQYGGNKETKLQMQKRAARKRTGSGIKGIGETAEGLFDEKVSANDRDWETLVAIVTGKH